MRSGLYSNLCHTWDWIYKKERENPQHHGELYFYTILDFYWAVIIITFRGTGLFWFFWICYGSGNFFLNAGRITNLIPSTASTWQFWGEIKGNLRNLGIQWLRGRNDFFHPYSTYGDIYIIFGRKKLSKKWFSSKMSNTFYLWWPSFDVLVRGMAVQLYTKK